MLKQPKKISNVEWGLLIGAAAFIDLIQFLIDLIVGGGASLFFGAGPFISTSVNWSIDVFVGMALAFYYLIRGIKPTKGKVAAWISATLLKFIPVLDGLPLWSLDVIVTMLAHKAEEKVASLSAKLAGNSPADNPNRPRGSA